jgi:hypothetical protein
VQRCRWVEPSFIGVRWGVWVCFEGLPGLKRTATNFWWPDTIVNGGKSTNRKNKWGQGGDKPSNDFRGEDWNSFKRTICVTRLFPDSILHCLIRRCVSQMNDARAELGVAAVSDLSTASHLSRPVLCVCGTNVAWCRAGTDARDPPGQLASAQTVTLLVIINTKPLPQESASVRVGFECDTTHTAMFEPTAMPGTPQLRQESAKAAKSASLIRHNQASLPRHNQAHLGEAGSPSRRESSANIPSGFLCSGANAATAQPRCGIPVKSESYSGYIF